MHITSSHSKHDLQHKSEEIKTLRIASVTILVTLQGVPVILDAKLPLGESQ